MTVDVDILTSNVRNALTVPNDAVSSDNGKSYVYVVRKGVAHKTWIRTGQSNDAVTIVQAGITPGQVIVAQKMPALKDGARVTPAPSAAPLSAS